MLTNLFYYDFYKPYIFKNEKITSKYPKSNSDKSKNSEARFLNDDKSENEYSFFLNKTFKKEIVNYAENISVDFNSIKNSVKNIINNVGGSYVNIDSKKEILKKELSELEEKYNSYKDFAENNYKNSSLLSEFSDNLKFCFEENSGVLAKFGMNYDNEAQTLYFDEEYFNSLNLSKMGKNINELSEFCKTVYDQTCEIMKVPMEEYMGFKNLSYYYNYIFSNENHNTVKIIETGMLVDISL